MKGSQSRSFDVKRDIYNEGYFLIPQVDALEVTTVRSTAASIDPSQLDSFFGYSGRAWPHAGFLDTFYNHLATPNEAIVSFTSYPKASVFMGIPPRRKARRGLVAATSNHASLVNTARLDGSVHVAADSIDLNIWLKLGSIDDD